MTRLSYFCYIFMTMNTSSLGTHKEQGMLLKEISLKKKKNQHPSFGKSLCI